MTTEEMIKFGYEKMVKNNPDEAIKELIRLNNLNDRIDKAIDLLKTAGCYDEKTKSFCDDIWDELPDLLNILQGSE